MNKSDIIKRNALLAFTSEPQTSVNANFKFQASFNILGDEVHFFDRNEWSDSLRSRVLKYYQGYGVSTGRKIQIHYRSLADPFASPNHPIWNDCVATTHSYNQVDQNFYISRDFAWVQSSQAQIYHVVGPDLEAFPSDTFDNLMNSLFTKFDQSKIQFLLHASAVEREGKAYVFFAPSEEGKSTLARLSYENRGYGVFGGDQIFLRVENDELWLYPSPSFVPEFPKEHLALKRSPARVAGLFRLQKRNELAYRAATISEILPYFLSEMMSSPGIGWSGQQILNAAMHTLKSHQGPLGFISYPKNQDLWRLFDQPMKELRNG